MIRIIKTLPGNICKHRSQFFYGIIFRKIISRHSDTARRLLIILKRIELERAWISGYPLESWMESKQPGCVGSWRSEPYSGEIFSFRIVNYHKKNQHGGQRKAAVFFSPFWAQEFLHCSTHVFRQFARGFSGFRNKVLSTKCQTFQYVWNK